MGLLTRDSNPEIHQTVMDMETLWREAIKLGRPTIDWCIGGGYQARILLHDRSAVMGSKQNDARDSLADAVRKGQHMLEVL